MWPVDPPAYAVAEVVVACTTRMRNRNLAKCVDDELTVLEAACARLHSAMQRGTTHLLEAKDFVSHRLSIDELEWLYDNRMAKGPPPGRPASAGRVIYDQIMAAPLFRRCPYCGVRPVSEMDHFLPKRQFSTLAICPSNLVAVCGDCNFVKSDDVATTEDEEFIHPYAPSWDGDIWLHAKVSDVEPPLVEFAVVAPATWSGSQVARAEKHFERYALGELYTLSGIALQGSIARYLRNLHGAGGLLAVSDHLAEMADSYREVRRNGWEAAMFAALSANRDYCDGLHGFAPV